MKLTYRFIVWQAKIDRWHVALAVGLLCFLASTLACVWIMSRI